MNEKMQQFQAIVDQFNAIWPEEAEKLIAAKAGAIIFIGKPECPYCQKFAPKLKEVVDHYPLSVNFILSTDTTHAKAIKAFRDKYQIPTVPCIIYAGEETRVRCDSSMTIEEITAFVNA